MVRACNPLMACYLMAIHRKEDGTNHFNGTRAITILGGETMARPIEATPTLTGRSAIRFERLMKNCKHHPTPPRKVNWKAIDQLIEKERGSWKKNGGIEE